MNQINSIYTTVSRGQVHIAADTKYVGSVDSYNNCFTQFFAWLFCRSMRVNFDGKEYSVNKQSYTNLVCALTKNDAINNIRERSIFRPIAETGTLPTGNLKMRDVITSEDRQALFQKLAQAISRGDTTKALLMIGKGAELDTVYYDRGNLRPSFNGDTSDLDANSRYAFTVFLAAPILQAARKGNAVVCKFLKEAGANLSVTGHQYTFKREILKVENRQELVIEPNFVPHHYHTKGRDTVHYRTEFRPQLRDRTVVTTQDFSSTAKSYHLEQHNFGVIES